MKARHFLIGALCVGVLSAILVYEFVPRKRLKRVFLIAIGQLIDIGGYRLRAKCSGSGEPPVVLDAGLTFGLQTWEKVMPEVAKFTRVCAYDRAGVGKSDHGKKPRTSQQIVSELHALVKKLNVKTPMVLVGHSFGGLNVRLYASEYPEEVGGLVLVDSSHEDQAARFAALMDANNRNDFLQREGGRNIEHVNVLASNEELRKAPALPNIPIVVLTASYSKWLPSVVGIEEARLDLQNDLAHLVPNSKHLIATHSGHLIQNDRPDLVIDAIKSVLMEVRQNSRSR